MYNLTFEASYPTPYATSHFLSAILLSMMSQKHTPNTTTDFKDAYDYIIVGAGSAGSIVASRLADENDVTVLLLEAGISPPKVTDIPAVQAYFVRTNIDWLYKTVPQNFTGSNLVNRTVVWSSGKMVGGSGALNAMLALRGNNKIYDDWAAQGALGWNYEAVLPYFKKLENNTNPKYVANGYHGTQGPIVVSNPPYESELKKAVLKTAKNMGYPVGDINGPIQSGFYDMQTTTNNGQRCSSAKAYLTPRENLPNLDILSEAFVRKVIIKNKIAVGVEFDFQGETKTVKACKEVILSAGGVGSAKLLMLSGIGPKEELAKHKIKVIADLPVGKNLQDHFASILPFALGDNIAPFDKKLLDENNINDYINNKTGPLTSSTGVATLAFLNKDGRQSVDDNPEVELYFWESLASAVKSVFNANNEFYNSYYKAYEGKPIYFCLSQILHPKGRGQITLRSSNPYDYPVIDPMYFSNMEDLETVAQGLKLCKKFGLSEPLKNIGSSLFSTDYPGCENFIHDDYFRCIARSFVMTIYHPVGTVKMGNSMDLETVVDHKLKVKGIGRLRVIDASVMPTITGGNTNVPTMMIAEKGSDMVKEDMHSIV